MIADLKVGRFSYADAGQMHMYLNYAREHWIKAGENPPVGLILCAEKGAAEAHYALDNLSNKVLAAEYQTVDVLRIGPVVVQSFPDAARAFGDVGLRAPR